MKIPRSRILPLLLVLASGCSYQLAGKGSFLPVHIETIGIPPFQSAVPRAALVEELTRAVTREFIERGGYRIIPVSTGADAILSGSITGLTETPVSFDQEGRATRSLLTITASVTMRDLEEGETIYQNSVFQFRSEIDIDPDSDLLLDPESEGITDIARQFARTLVATIVEGF